MKKLSFLLLVAILATGCKGIYIPYASNHFGAQSQVVLDKANFRVVRNVEVVVDFDNSNMRRADAEKSAYGELLRQANLTGSQVLINVVVEEILRKGFHKHQYVAARATIIEFIDENGNPTVSKNYRPSNHSNSETQTITTEQTNVTSNDENVGVEESRIVIVTPSKKKEKPKKPTEPLVSYDVKQKVTSQFVQVQQKYRNLGLSKSPINVAYTKAMGQIMMSQSIEDWQLAGKISTLVDNLTEENCSIDKVALESQLAEVTTTPEIIEVFKKYIQ